MRIHILFSCLKEGLIFLLMWFCFLCF